MFDLSQRELMLRSFSALGQNYDVHYSGQAQHTHTHPNRTQHLTPLSEFEYAHAHDIYTHTHTRINVRSSLTVYGWVFLICFVMISIH